MPLVSLCKNELIWLQIRSIQKRWSADQNMLIKNSADREIEDSKETKVQALLQMSQNQMVTQGTLASAAATYVPKHLIWTNMLSFWRNPWRSGGREKVYVMDVTALSKSRSSARVENPVRPVIKNIRRHSMATTGSKKKRTPTFRVMKVNGQILMGGRMMAKSPTRVTPFVMWRAGDIPINMGIVPTVLAVP